MKTPIDAISITRNMLAMKHNGFSRETTVAIIRGDVCKVYYTNPLRKVGRISDASVLRAKRAQLKLMEQSQVEL